MKAFETTIIAHDPYANPARAAALGVELVELEELMARADFVTIHLPKTEETSGMFDAELLAKAKKGQIIINAARGGLVDEQALADSIKAGHHRGAGFDVYASEPCTDSPLFELPEVTVSPHLGASTVEAQDRAGTDVADSVLKALAGEFVADAVNVSGGRVGEEVAGWLDLARKLGLTAGKLLGQAPVAIEVEARGELSNEDVSALGLSAVRGLFSGVLSEAVTFVNAMQIAESRGVNVEVRTRAESKGQRSSSLSPSLVRTARRRSSLAPSRVSMALRSSFASMNAASTCAPPDATCSLATMTPQAPWAPWVRSSALPASTSSLQLLRRARRQTTPCLFCASSARLQKSWSRTSRLPSVRNVSSWIWAPSLTLFA